MYGKTRLLKDAEGKGILWLLLLELITCNCFVGYNDGGCGVQCSILHYIHYTGIEVALLCILK